jgi:hypothetical protein
MGEYNLTTEESPYEGAFKGAVGVEGGEPASVGLTLTPNKDIVAPDQFKVKFDLKNELDVPVGFLCGGTRTLKKRTWNLDALVAVDTRTVTGSKTFAVDGVDVLVGFAATFKEDLEKADLNIKLDIQISACADPELNGNLTRI